MPNFFATAYEEIDYAYTDGGKIDAITFIDGTGAVQKRSYFRYGSDGVLNEITTSDADNKTIAREIYKYDTAGNIARISSYAVAKKFGTTVTELVGMSELTYEY